MSERSSDQFPYLKMNNVNWSKHGVCENLYYDEREKIDDAAGGEHEFIE